ncbi:HisA/HisF-related TIM barrel protein [Streptomyces sp. CA-294286]|uniref:HisA/HisF-related TIM barrel protein n=1 Tax=Streptomyces sp. CA-294286 TaxID=3240070 RepID=UPI003D8B73F8
MIDLFHCFGAKPAHRVDTALAAEMLRASGCRYLAVNTHTIDRVSRGEDLPIGYDSATLGSVTALVGDELGLHPVLNINHPTSAAEAVKRTRQAAQLTGIRVIKLEVLDPGFRLSVNAEVVEAARELTAEGFEVWPLITPDARSFAECVELGSMMVRVMGSAIGARKGIEPQHLESVRELLADSPVPVMLDGGIGSTADVEQAFALGFQSVLVNSCLFADGTDPVTALAGFRATVDRVASGTPTH